MSCSLIGTSANCFKMVKPTTTVWRLDSSHAEENPNAIVDHSINNIRFDKAREVILLLYLALLGPQKEHCAPFWAQILEKMWPN